MDHHAAINSHLRAALAGVWTYAKSTTTVARTQAAAGEGADPTVD